MPKIVDISSREILDSRGLPTLETEVRLDDGICAKASVPSGASKGKYEAYDLRDNDKKRFHGLGVLKAIENIKNKIKPALQGMEVNKQKEIDMLMIELDGTQNKSNLGANSILSVSLACARAAASSYKIALYKYVEKLAGMKSMHKHVTPLFNVINGGVHGANRRLTVQEFFVIPDFSFSFSESIRIGVEIYQKLKQLIKNSNLSVAVGDEGGFSPEVDSNDLAIGLLIEAIQKTGFAYGKDVAIGLDMASNSYYKEGKYTGLYTTTRSVSVENYLSEIKMMKNEYDLILLEDPLREDDWESWSKLTAEIGKNTLIIGDDLLVTNIKRLKKAIEEKACNGVLVKPNQIGTLTETLEVIRKAKEANFKTVVSHRSGETNDDFIADLAVAVGADFVKFGAPVRGERVAKYNRLLQIYQELNS